MISVEMIGRLGNHMWQYAVCRTLAERNGYEFHIPRSFMGSDLFGCSLGVEHDQTRMQYTDSYMHNSFMAQFYNPNIIHLQDFTKLVGFFQSERYILENKKNIQEWFTLKNPNLELLEKLNLTSEVCVINYRGGDYKDIPDVYLSPDYWSSSVEQMKKLHDNLKFIVITDDIDEAEKLFPDFPVHHFSVAEDFLVISHAKYLIIANSTFSWWGAWLNKACKTVIAPKFWMRHNQSNGWWAPGESITKGFSYMGKDGRLYSSGECIDEVNALGLSYANFPY
jgi:Glycosyl transferase family 11